MWRYLPVAFGTCERWTDAGRNASCRRTLLQRKHIRIMCISVCLKLKTLAGVVMLKAYPPASRRCVLPAGGCSCRRHSGNTHGGRSSPRRSASPSRTPAWCRSGKRRCRRAREGGLYAAHTESEGGGSTPARLKGRKRHLVCF